MNYRTFVGLDVHKNSIVAYAHCPSTEKGLHKKFGYDVKALTEWINSLEGPVKTVYESGFCGFSLKRELDALGIECAIAAISKCVKPSGNKVKTDRTDAEFLAKQLAAAALVEVSPLDIELEGMRDISRMRELLRDSLTAAKHRVSQMVLRYGFRFLGKERNWSDKHRRWLSSLEMPTHYAQAALDFYLEEVWRLETEKARVEQAIKEICKQEPLKTAVEVFGLIKGMSTITAFCICVEIGNFQRFKNARAFAAYLGLTPSEDTSDKKVSRGPITKTGNTHVRKALIEAAWAQSRVKTAYKMMPVELDPEIAKTARSINSRLMKRRKHLVFTQKKKACVANTAIARETAASLWALAQHVNW
jgi:transposase